MILAMAATMLLTACEDQTVVYNVTVEGQANGVVTYTVPTVQGKFTASGDLLLVCSNDVTLTASAVPLGAALEGEGDVAEKAEETLNWLTNAFQFDGDYHVRVHGYVKYLGITFEIDEELPKTVDVPTTVVE